LCGRRPALSVSGQTFEACMTYRALEQPHHIAAVLALPDETKHGIERCEVTIHDLLGMRGAHVDAGRREIAPGQHLLREERAVGESPWTCEGEHGKRRQPTGGDFEAVPIGELPPPRADVGADPRNLLPRAAALHNLKRLKRRGRPDALGPE